LFSTTTTPAESSIPAALLLAPELAPPSDPKRFRETITRRFAAMARFGANAVVLVVSGVPLTLRAAHATRFGTCADLRAQEADVPFSLSRHDLSRGLTDDGASRQSVMLLMSCVTAGSARESSVHAVQAYAHSTHASIHSITRVSSGSWTCLRALRSSMRRTSCS
jgi:hypothetical protein